MELQSSRVGAVSTPQGVDISKLVSESTQKLHSEKTKRVRRTKAEIEAARAGGSERAPLNQNANQPSGLPLPPPRDRTKELAPAFQLYSDLFLAKPLDCEEVKLTLEESEILAKVTSDCMNAFPEYFNQADPKVTAVVGMFLVALPIGYSKYRIYQAHVINKNKKTETLEIK